LTGQADSTALARIARLSLQGECDQPLDVIEVDGLRPGQPLKRRLRNARAQRTGRVPEPVRIERDGGYIR
jgi:hypothetical protein